MNTESDRELAAIEQRLAALPEWQPPTDFAARLAAAAARQSSEPAIRPLPTRAWLWARLVHHLPLAIGTSLAVLLLAVLPWTAMASSPAFVWIIAGSAAATGLAMTMRVLRTP